MRGDAVGLVRLLLLAFALQLAAPLSNLAAIAAGAGEAGLQADLLSSLCHDPGPGGATDQGGAPQAQAKHCIFCMPMAGSHAAAAFTPLAPLPNATTALMLPSGEGRAPSGSCPSFARARAPPATPRTV
jgi:hypothetical protein